MIYRAAGRRTLRTVEDAVNPERHSLIRAMPKVELHVHLEGSVRPTTFLRLARRHGLDVGALDERSVVELFRFRDFAHFIELYERCSRAMREPDDFELVVIELGLAAHRQHVRYLEVTFTPSLHERDGGIPFDEQLDAVARGAVEVHRQTGIDMRFVLDHVRGWSVDECARVAEWAVAGRDRGVVALGLGGYEPGRPASLFAEPIEWAAARGVPLVPHAGEAVGPEGVRDCLRFAPPRIGHGFRAAEDPALMIELIERGTVLDVCPTSNVCTGTVTDLAAHPVRRLWDAGVRLTLNSDDPSMFATDVVREYQLAADIFGFTPAELAAMTLVGVDAALLPPAPRADLRARVVSELAALGLTPEA
jgi:adenosine deaminase